MAIITITRGLKSGGELLAHELEKRLGHKCMGRDVISACARKYNIMEEDLYEKLTEAPNLWKRMTQEHKRYLIYIKCSLIEAAHQDNIIYHGYAGHLYLDGIQHVLKVRLEAPFEDRVQRMMADTGLSQDEAAAALLKADEERRRWVKYLHDKDWYDPALYDFVANLSNISLDTACEIIETLARSEEFATTPRSLNRLKDLLLESEVLAAITADDRIWDQNITVVAQNGVVTIRGMVKRRKLKDLIVETAKAVKGVTSCQAYVSLPSDKLAGGIFGHD
jgi:cytidylate kinase